MAETDYRTELPERIKQARAHPVKKAQRRRMVLDLRAAGLSEQQIAEEITRQGHKMSQQGVSMVLRNALRDMAEQDQDDVRKARQLDLNRIERMIQSLWPQVIGASPSIKAVREIRGLLDQRARLLGTNAPTKHEIRGQIEGLLSPDERDEIRRLQEAFVASAAPVTDATVVEDDPALLDPPAVSGDAER